MREHELFEKLARDGECWHELRSIIPFNPEKPYFYKCKKCKLLTNDIEKDINPDFTTWTGFGWLWERAQEQDWWRRFYFEMLHEFDPIFLVKRLSEETIHPARFRDAIKEYLKEE